MKGKRMKKQNDFIERWAAYVRSSSGGWKKEHSTFINAQFAKAEAFLERLKKQEGGKEKIRELYQIKNKKGYPSLFP